MSKNNIIDLLKKYKKIAGILSLDEDIALFNESISLINKIFNDEEIFYTMISDENIDFSKYNINQEIIKHKDDISSYWKYISNDEKSKLRTLDLNIIRYILNKNNCGFTKNRKIIIEEIDYFSREKINSISLEFMVK